MTCKNEWSRINDRPTDRARRRKERKRAPIDRTSFASPSACLSGCHRTASFLYALLHSSFDAPSGTSKTS
eukprot:30202-Pelagococcus_subviridis.AAC.2